MFLFSAQVTILRQLQHPSLVSMEGVALNPRVLVLELAQLGSLASVLRSKKVTNRSLQHRIAMQVQMLTLRILRGVISQDFFLISEFSGNLLETSNCLERSKAVIKGLK